MATPQSVLQSEPNLKRLSWTPERREQQRQKMSLAWADRQNRENLRKAISQGTKKSKGQRPSVSELAATVGVSVSTLYHLWSTNRITQRPAEITPEYAAKIKPQVERAMAPAARSARAKEGWTQQRRKRHSVWMSEFYTDPDAKERQRESSRKMWAKLSPGERQQRSGKSTAHNRTVEGRRKIAKGTKKGLASPDVRRRLSVARRKDWAARNADKVELEKLRTWSASASKLGRPRKDATRARVLGLRSQGKSWGEIRIIVNRETGQQLTSGAYRYLASKPTK